MTNVRRLSTRVLILVSAMIVVNSLEAAAQSHYERAGMESTPDPEVFVTIDPLGPTCSNGTHTVPNQGFVKSGTRVFIDAKQTVSGHCDFYIGAAYYWSEYRWITYIVWEPTPPGGLNYYAGGPATATDTQTYDTRNPGSGNSGTFRDLAGVGKWTLDVHGTMYTTPCLYPTASTTVRQQVNVMTCQPKWAKIGNPAKTHHLPATTIYIFVPESMYTRLVGNNSDGPAVQAANDWSTILDGVGPQFEVTDVDCGSGPNCISLEETNDSIAGCAAWQGGLPNYSTGEITSSSSTMKFPAATWANASDERLRRTINHELGHGLGMEHNHPQNNQPGCTGAESIMGAQSSCTTLGTLSATPTTQDSLQTTTSPYGNDEETVCAF